MTMKISNVTQRIPYKHAKIKKETREKKPLLVTFVQ